MNNNKIIKLLIAGIVVSLLLAVLGASYAYFSLIIEGESKNMVTEMGSLRLKYDDTDVINLSNITPGESVTKVITVKNIGSLDVSYNIVWDELYNEFINKELTIEMKCTRLNGNGDEEGTCEDLTSVPIGNIKIKTNINIETNITHKYEVKITFVDTGASQNYNKNAKFQGKINLTKYSSNEPIYCNFDGDLIQGTEYVNGQYTYRYMQEFTVNFLPVSSNYNEVIPATFMSSNNVKKIYNDYSWVDIDEDGWGVTLTDKESTDDVDTSLCTYINNKPVVSMNDMFSNSNTTSIDFTNFNTSNVINMYGMFANIKTKVLDLSNFDTSGVTNMAYMFYMTYTSTLDLSSFNTSSVTDMHGMFSENKSPILDLSNFDTSNVTNMTSMFSSSQAKILELSNFDTSKVTNMNDMFAHSQATTLDVSNFDTSNVTNMGGIFWGSKVETIDVSNFDTSKVTDMSDMFSSCYYLTTIYVSDKFVTTNIVNVYDPLFYDSINLIGGAGTKYSSSNTGKTYARIDGGTSSPGYFTLKS